MERVLITGVTGQTGSYLAEYLLEEGYDVYGLVRHCSTKNDDRIKHLGKLKICYGDLTDSSSILNCIENIKPDYIFNLAAQSHVHVSFSEPEYTANVTGVGVLRILDAVKRLNFKHTRILHASTSEMFGNSPSPQSELTILSPESPYAAAKVYAYHITRNYRKSYDMFISNSICFNHASERRGLTFVSRKITRAVAMIYSGFQNELRLGNIDTYRDWGHALDYAKAMLLILKHDKPDDFIVATGETHCVREFLELAFDRVGLDPYKYLIIDKEFYRPSDVLYLLGDPTKIKTTLNWKPEISFKELVYRMVDNDIKLIEKVVLNNV